MRGTDVTGGARARGHVSTWWVGLVTAWLLAALGGPAVAGAATTQDASEVAERVSRAAEVAEGRPSPARPLRLATPSAPPTDERTADAVAPPLTAGARVDDPAVLVRGAAGQFGIGLPSALRSREATVAPDGSLVAVDAGRRPDAAVQQLDGRIRLQAVIEDAASGRVGYPVALAEGLRLAPRADGGIDVVDAAGARFASVAAPWAVDAAGRRLATRYELGAGTIVQVVDGLAAATLPVVADPSIEGGGTNGVAGTVVGGLLNGAKPIAGVLAGGIAGVVKAIGVAGGAGPKVVKAPPKTPLTIKPKPAAAKPPAKPKLTRLDDLPLNTAGRRELDDTLRRLDRGGPFRYPKNDGRTFANRERVLPQKEPGYYREFTVHTPGATSRALRRVVTGKNGERYYSHDHYKTFARIR